MECVGALIDYPLAVDDLKKLFNLNDLEIRGKLNSLVGAEGATFEEFAAKVRSIPLLERRPIMDNVATKCLARQKTATDKGRKTEAQRLELLMNALSYLVEIHADHCEVVLGRSRPIL